MRGVRGGGCQGGRGGEGGREDVGEGEARGGGGSPALGLWEGGARPGRRLGAVRRKPVLHVGEAACVPHVHPCLWPFTWLVLLMLMFCTACR